MSMSSMLTEAAQPSSTARVRARKTNQSQPASEVLDTIAEHVLLDGFRIVIDLEKSRGAYLHNAAGDQR